jgi:hypothetical protein
MPSRTPVYKMVNTSTQHGDKLAHSDEFYDLIAKKLCSPLKMFSPLKTKCKYICAYLVSLLGQ